MTLARYPKAVVFDLDYTLWPCWCDTHIMTPLKSVSPTTVVDRYDFQLSFYKDVESIIRELVENDVKIIAASRTATPHIAKQLLSMLHSFYLTTNGEIEMSSRSIVILLMFPMNQ